MSRKFVRFITHQADPVTGVKVGFFAAVYALRRGGNLNRADADVLSAALDWFDENLDAPTRFHRSNNPHAHGKAISWFKPEAAEQIRRARDVLQILERNGIPSEMLTTSRPGYVVFEDSMQICAIPFREDR